MPSISRPHRAVSGLCWLRQAAHGQGVDGHRAACRQIVLCPIDLLLGAGDTTRIFGEAVCYRRVLALDSAHVLQALAECGQAAFAGAAQATVPAIPAFGKTNLPRIPILRRWMRA